MTCRRPARPVRHLAGLLATLAAAWLCIQSAGAVAAAEGRPVEPPARDATVRFEEDVLPVLAANCVACHNAKVREGGLMLDSVAAILKGGDSGPGVVAGKPAESVLFLRATHRQGDVMPPPDNKVAARPLSPVELGLLERWIATGAAAGPAVARQPIAWRPLPRGVGPVPAVAITADGRLTAAARGNGVGVFDTRSGRLIETLVDPATAAAEVGQAHLDAVSAVAFAPDGDRLATGSFRTVKVWRRRPPLQVAEIADSAGATAAAAAPGGTLVALGLPDGRIALADPAAGRGPRLISAHAGPVTALIFTAAGASLCSAGRDGLVLTIRVEDGVVTGRLPRQGAVPAIALLAGGTRLATAESDSVVRIWQLPLPAPEADLTDPALQPKPLHELTAGGQSVTALLDMPSMSDHLLTGGGDGIVRLWKTDTAAVVRQFAHEAPLTALALTADGTRLATVGAAAGARLWETASGKRIAEAKGDHRRADRLAAADVSLAVARQDLEFAKAEVAAAEKGVQAATEESKKAAEQNAATEKQRAEKSAAAAAAAKAKQEADGVATQAAAALATATQIHEAATNVAAAAAATDTSATALVAALKAAGTPAEPAAAEAVKPLDAAAATAKAARATADQAAAQAAQQVEQAKLRAAEAAKKAADALAAQTAAAEAQSQAELAVTVAKRAVESAAEQERRTAAAVPLRGTELKDAEGRLAAAEESRRTADAAVNAASAPFVAAAFSADGERLACLDADGRIVVLGGGDGQPRTALDGARPAGTAAAAAFLSGQRLLVAGGSQAATLWDLSEPWSLERTIGGERTPPAADDDPAGPPVDIVTALAFSPDAAALASGSGRASRSGEVKLWKTADGTLARTLAHPHSDTVMTLAFSRRGDLLASGAADRFLKVHAVADGAPLRSYEGHTGHVLGVSWQANGRRLASAGADNVIKVWDTASGEQQRTIPVGKKEVTAAQFVGAGEELVVASGDPVLRLVNAGTGATIREFRDPGAFLQAAAVAPPFVVGGSQDGRLRIWDLASGAALHAIEALPGK